MTGPSTPLRDRAIVVLAALCSVVALAGCSSGSVASPPAGVDGLVVPTPSPRAGDFVPRVTNPWFPLRPGTRMVYDVSDIDGDHPLLVRVAPGPVIAGVGTTARVATERGRSTTDWYAQDRSGNVWWFGRAGEWRAGTGGAEAGLAVPADPRVGDGWATGYAAGADVGIATVLTRSAAIAVPQGEHHPVLALEVTTPATGEDRDVYYARGTGLLEESTQRAVYRIVQLVRVVPAAGPASP